MGGIQARERGQKSPGAQPKGLASSVSSLLQALASEAPDGE